MTIAMSRRMAMACGTALLALPGEVLAARRRRRLVVNSLGGIGNPDDPVELAAAARSAMAGVVITLGAERGGGRDGVEQLPDAWDYLLSSIEDYDAKFARHQEIVQIRTAADIRAAYRDGRVGIIYGIQNGYPIEDKIDRIGFLRDKGLRVFQLTYNNVNLIGSGTLGPESQGLTPFGREVIGELERLRMIIDLSHSNMRTCMDAAQAAKGPICITHTGCRAVADRTRNKTDAELKLVADRGGYVGIYTVGFLRKSGQAMSGDWVAHTRHALNICGEDHVGVGTDGDVVGYQDTPETRARISKILDARHTNGIAAPDETVSDITFPNVLDLMGPRQFDKMADLLHASGVKPRVVDKVMGGNFLRFAEAVW